ncbi:MAG: hypothetical protein BWX84_02111 [Verrucomicrobia bacterium ADurb.Bin118]|jgi:hypothetical protein|nr:MAG: hypothetical protein BWX84_02111 [Verrucomicrobia bacterium ADurb.Bin118]
MPKFVCSYVYDIACYADFVVEAKTRPGRLRQEGARGLWHRRGWPTHSGAA